MIKGGDITEETRQWLELRKNVAQQQGKQSHHYMHKMTWEIIMESKIDNGKEEELVEQT